MEFSFGVLHIMPNVFWEMTMIEFWAACRGYQRTKPKSEEAEGMGRTKFEQMMDMYPDDY